MMAVSFVLRGHCSLSKTLTLTNPQQARILLRRPGNAGGEGRVETRHEISQFTKTKAAGNVTCPSSRSARRTREHSIHFLINTQVPRVHTCIQSFFNTGLLICSSCLSYLPFHSIIDSNQTDINQKTSLNFVRTTCKWRPTRLITFHLKVTRIPKVRLQVLTAPIMRTAAFCLVALCSLVGVC